ncbi:hypothetical protein B5E64_05715 [Drancourtella sp. An12]|uniref:InlB B-repeat-containing protein n=1 Tax=Drancourtella sp. An12 TaxID=1965548 RepID=UPI000B38F935|nr:InlB B-repeat-containing protein [Drancourtella sp. An12]OUQ46255.1 hypothetical protein B5E64_05715 [Drancourtella sp. An12]
MRRTWKRFLAGSLAAVMVCSIPMGYVTAADITGGGTSTEASGITELPKGDGSKLAKILDPKDPNQSLEQLKFEELDDLTAYEAVLAAKYLYLRDSALSDHRQSLTPYINALNAIEEREALSGEDREQALADTGAWFAEHDTVVDWEAEGLASLSDYATYLDEKAPEFQVNNRLNWLDKLESTGKEDREAAAQAMLLDFGETSFADVSKASTIAVFAAMGAEKAAVYFGELEDREAYQYLEAAELSYASVLSEALRTKQADTVKFQEYADVYWTVAGTVLGRDAKAAADYRTEGASQYLEAAVGKETRKEQGIKDHASYMEYLAELSASKDFTTIRQNLDDVDTKKDTAQKQLENFKSYLEEVYGFDSQETATEEPEADAESKEEPAKTETPKKSAPAKAAKAAAAAPRASVGVTYQAHVDQKGWLGWVSNGATGGTTGQNLSMQAIQIKGSGFPSGSGIQYRAHVQTKGWIGWVSNGATGGTTGQSKRMEAIQIKLTGAIANQYHIQYRAHVEDIGWMNWVENGATAGTTGESKAVQAIQIRLVPVVARNINTGATYCSIQEAVNAASAGQTIGVIASHSTSGIVINKNITIYSYGGNYTVTNSNKNDSVFEVQSGKTLTLGGSSNTLTINANNGNQPTVDVKSGSIFYLKSGATLSNSYSTSVLNLGTTYIQGGTITGGERGYLSDTPRTTGDGFTKAKHYNGSGIYNKGTLNISSGTISNNYTWMLGTIFNGGKLTMTGGTISGNKAHYGAGIYNAAGVSGYNGSLNITGGSFTNNSTINGWVEGRKLGLSMDSTDFSPFAGNGGAIFTGAHNSPSISNVTFSGNTGSFGGAVFAGPDGKTQTGYTITIKNCKFQNNTATAAGYDADSSIANSKERSCGGGAISSHMAVSISGSTFTNNKQVNDSWSEQQFGYYGHGGAIRMRLGGTISGCTFTGNTAAIGGAISMYDPAETVSYTANYSSNTVSGNSATRAGGGFYFDTKKGSVNMTSNTVQSNKNTGSIGGGGAYIASGTTAKITGGSFSGNTSTLGGGVCNWGTTTLSGVTFTNNTASQKGGGAYQAGTMYLNGALAMDATSDIYLPTGKRVDINAALTKTSGLVAKFTPQDYYNGRVLARVAYGTKLATTEFAYSSGAEKFQLAANGSYIIRPGNKHASSSSVADSDLVISTRYNLNYVANKPSSASGSVSNMPSNGFSYWNENTTLSSLTPTLTGYTFKNWNTAASGSGTSYSKGQTVLLNKALTIYAQWTPNTYKVVYNGNGATGGSTATSTHTYDVAKNLTANGFTKTGYRFAGWATSASGSVVYSDKQSVKNLTSVNGGTVTLYAKWTPNTYKVVYNGNGATGGSTATSTHTYDVAKNLTANGFAKTGYIFQGWATSANGSVVYSNGQSVKNLTATHNGTVTLYAKWSPIGYTVIYNGNGATGGSTASSSHTYDVAKNLTANGFSKTGYHFGGWATSATGSVVYSNMQSVKNLTTTNGAKVNLYAKWTPNTYKVVYNGNGATGGSTASSSHTYDVAKNLTANGFTKTGYTFAGWATSSGGSVVYKNGQSVKNLTSVNGGTVNLYAKWTPITYTVVYNGNGATGGSTASSSHTYDVAKNLTANGYTRTGYTFIGWSTTASGSVKYTNGQSVKNLTSVNGATITLYAQWKINTYTNTISHWAGGFKNSEGNNSNKTMFKLTDTNFKADYASKYVMDSSRKTTIPNGFYLNTSFGTSYISGSWKSYAMGTSVTQQAKAGSFEYDYYPTTYKITYDLAGGTHSGNPSTYNVLYGVTFKNPTRKGYTFSGWYMDGKKVTGINPGATASFTSASDLYSKLSTRTTGNKTVTAKWTPIKYEISYDGNGATGGSTPNTSLTYDTPGTVAENGYTWESHVFVEWNTKPDGSGTSYKPGDKVTNLTDKNGDVIKVYAIWDEQIRVVYLGNGATSGSQKSEVVTESQVRKAGGYTVKKNAGYTAYKKNRATYIGWDKRTKVNAKETAYRESNVNIITWEDLEDIRDYAKAQKAKSRMAVRTMTASADTKAASIEEAPLNATWDEAPTIDTTGKAGVWYYEGTTVTRDDLLEGITASDDVDGSLTNKIIITKIAYSAGKVVDGTKQPAYQRTWTNGMPASENLDTWFLQLAKEDKKAVHTVTYQVTDSVGNVTTATAQIEVRYNEFPTITSEDRYFTLDEAKAGKITANALLNDTNVDGTRKTFAWDNEENDLTNRLTLLDFNADEFKHFEESGYRKVTLHVQDSMGPGGKGKETTKQITVYVVKDGEIPEVEKAKNVRFIDEKNYNKNKDCNPDTMTQEEKDQANKNGGLNVDSKWYTEEDYRDLIQETFQKTSGTVYSYTLDDIEEMREFVDEHGVGNSQEADALDKFAEKFNIE